MCETKTNKQDKMTKHDRPTSTEPIGDVTTWYRKNRSNHPQERKRAEDGCDTRTLLNRTNDQEGDGDSADGTEPQQGNPTPLN